MIDDAARTDTEPPAARDDGPQSAEDRDAGAEVHAVRGARSRGVGGRPLWCAFRTRLGHPAMSEKCQERTFRYGVARIIRSLVTGARSRAPVSDSAREAFVALVPNYPEVLRRIIHVERRNRIFLDSED